MAEQSETPGEHEVLARIDADPQLLARLKAHEPAAFEEIGLELSALPVGWSMTEPRRAEFRKLVETSVPLRDVLAKETKRSARTNAAG